MTTEIITSDATDPLGVPEDGNRGTLHEKNLFEATLRVGLNKDALVSHLIVKEVEADLLTIEQDGEEIARIHHGYVHSTIIVFADNPVTRQLLRDNYITDIIELEADEELYSEVKPAAVWARKIRQWGEENLVNAMTQWRRVHIGTDTKTGAEWFHSIYNAKLLK